MPVDKQVNLRYRTLNTCFRNIHREYDIDNLVEACCNSLSRVYGDYKGVSKRTVQEDIKNFQLPPFNAVFDETLWSGHKKIYRYKDANFSIPFLPLTDSEKDKLKDVIDILSLFNGIPQYDWVRIILSQLENDVDLDMTKPLISFQNNPDFTGIEHFQVLLGSIMNKQPLIIGYQPYKKEESKKEIHPYFLKQFNDRWFLLAKENGFDSISVYPLDRITSTLQQHIDFKPSDINFEDYFDDVIGVSVDKNKVVEDVVLRISNKRYPYVLTKPIHNTQTEIKQYSEDGFHFIRIRVQINNELEALILSLGEDVVVLSPTYLRDRIKYNLRRTIDQYSNNEENLHS